MIRNNVLKLKGTKAKRDLIISESLFQYII